MPDQSDEGLKIENALLYRRLILLETSLIKHSAALELATGVPWDTTDLNSLNADGLREVVAQNMAHGLNISILEAHKRIRANEISVRKTQVEVPEPNGSE
jgi:hypothetical protein